MVELSFPLVLFYGDFMEYIEDESVYWMDGKQEATEKTYMLESIRDDIFYQTN